MQANAERSARSRFVGGLLASAYVTPRRRDSTTILSQIDYVSVKAGITTMLPNQMASGALLNLAFMQHH
jgi:hypothetical protein